MSSTENEFTKNMIFPKKILLHERERLILAEEIYQL